MVRTEIIDQILSRILTKNENVYPFLALLQSISYECQEGIEENIEKIRNVMDYICLLDPDVSNTILEVAIPHVCANGDLLNNLMLMLKKGIFNRYFIQISLLSLLLHGF